MKNQSIANDRYGDFFIRTIDIAKAAIIKIIEGSVVIGENIDVDFTMSWVTLSLPGSGNIKSER
jgi:hypothetical protein